MAPASNFSAANSNRRRALGLTLADKLARCLPPHRSTWAPYGFYCCLNFAGSLAQIPLQRPFVASIGTGLSTYTLAFITT